MSLASEISHELNALSATPSTIAVDCDVGRFEADIVQRDTLAVAFDRLEMASDQLAGAAPDDLKKLGEDLAARLTYLVEPISPIELDSQGATLQLRSNPPQQDDDGTTYFELLVRRGGSLSLCRYRKSPTATRQPIAATLTREVFLRLAGDFAAVLED